MFDWLKKLVNSIYFTFLFKYIFFNKLGWYDQKLPYNKVDRKNMFLGSRQLADNILLKEFTLFVEKIFAEFLQNFLICRIFWFAEFSDLQNFLICRIFWFAEFSDWQNFLICRIFWFQYTGFLIKPLYLLRALSKFYTYNFLSQKTNFAVKNLLGVKKVFWRKNTFWRKQFLA